MLRRPFFQFGPIPALTVLADAGCLSLSLCRVSRRVVRIANDVLTQRVYAMVYVRPGARLV